MPSAPRQSGKAQKIFEKILGTPPNLREPKKTKNQKKVDRRLLFEETSKVR